MTDNYTTERSGPIDNDYSGSNVLRAIIHRNLVLVDPIHVTFAAERIRSLEISGVTRPSDRFDELHAAKMGEISPIGVMDFLSLSLRSSRPQRDANPRGLKKERKGRKPPGPAGRG